MSSSGSFAGPCRVWPFQPKRSPTMSWRAFGRQWMRTCWVNPVTCSFFDNKNLHNFVIHFMRRIFLYHPIPLNLRSWILNDSKNHLPENSWKNRRFKRCVFDPPRSGSISSQEFMVFMRRLEVRFGLYSDHWQRFLMILVLQNSSVLISITKTIVISWFLMINQVSFVLWLVSLLLFGKQCFKTKLVVTRFGVVSRSGARKFSQVSHRTKSQIWLPGVV